MSMIYDIEMVALSCWTIYNKHTQHIQTIKHLIKIKNPSQT